MKLVTEEKALEISQSPFNGYASKQQGRKNIAQVELGLCCMCCFV